MAADPNAYPVQGPNAPGNPFQTEDLPPGGTGSLRTPVRGNQQGANQINGASLLGAAGKTTYLSGCLIIVGGATAALNVVATITGILGGTVSLPVQFVAGVGAAPSVIEMEFDPPIPSSALNTNISVQLPAGGAGNVVAGVFAWGFLQ